MKRSEIKHMPQYFDRYINLVDDVELIHALEHYGTPYLLSEKQNFITLGDNVYSPGKWTVKDILQHLIDAERVFAYRAMRIGRGDATPLPGFDENAYAVNTTVAAQTLDDLLAEFDAMRRSNIFLFKGLTSDMLTREGTASGKTISPLAIGFTITGHVIHHMNILKERYYPAFLS